MMNINPPQDNRDCKILSQVSWRAILSGLVIGLVAEILLNLLGVGFGLTAFNTHTDILTKMNAVSLVWFVIVGVIAMFLSGWFTGRLGALQTEINGALHGLMTWASITLIIFMLMASTAGSIIGGSVNLLGQNLHVATGAASLMSDNNSPHTASNNTDMNNPVDQQLILQKAEQAKQKAVETANPATSILGTIAIVTFFMLILGAIAALLGGIAGVRASHNSSCAYPIEYPKTR